MVIIVGKGLFHALELDKIPAVGAELNLRSVFAGLSHGRFRVTSIDTIQWGKEDFPHIIVDRIDDVPQGQEALPMALLSV